MERERGAEAREPALPDGLEYVRTTPVFDEASVPPGLLRAHHVADGVWARLVVRTGVVRFVFDDRPDDPRVLRDGEAIVIPPVRRHHVVLDGPASFCVEFYRERSVPPPAPGTESTALR